MLCPVCTDEKLMMTDRQGVEIDYCSKCRGIWLDRGELDKIIDRSSSSNQTNQATQPIQQIPRDAIRSSKKYEEPKYKKQKPGGYLSELFDF